jgi:predicted lactoylglutathione lyase
MPKMIFVNLPVRDLAKATAFYEAIGAEKNPQFSDHTAACMVFSETIFVMLLTHEKYLSFSKKPVAERGTSEVLIAFTQDGRAEVDAVLARGAAAGGRADPNPVQELGFMYSRSLEDPDGHVWEMFWMDPAAVAGEQPMAETA